MEPSIVAQVIAAFQPGSGVQVETLDKTTEAYRDAKQIELSFTAGVDVLRTVFPNERVRSLGAYAWEVFHHRYVVLALGPRVPSLTFAALGKVDSLQGILLAPHNWLDLIRENPLMQLGAIVMCASQAVDFHNGRLLIDDRKVIETRALSYETEYLRALGPALKPNDYQTQVLAKFPTFDPSLDYDRKPVVAPS